MDKSRIDFNNIASLNYSNRTNQYYHYIEDCNTNDNILLFRDEDYVLDKKEVKKNNLLEFERILKETKQKYISLSEKTEKIINSKSFSFKKLLSNNLNIQSIQHEEKYKLNNNSNNNKNITSKENTTNLNITENKNTNNNLFISTINKSLLNNNNNSINIKMKNHFKIIEPFNNNNQRNNILLENSEEMGNSKFIGNKRKQQINNNNKEKIESDIKVVFNEVLVIFQEISNLNNKIIKKEEANNLNTDNENIEITLIINDDQIVTIYLNKNKVTKLYVYKNKKYLIKENDILSQLKLIKTNMNQLLDKLKKK